MNKDFSNYLKDGERLDDLEFNDMFIISNKDKYCFTSDSVMLANLIKCNAKSTLVDLCCGGGIIGLLVTAKTTCKKVIGVEIQPDMADMATRSVKMNGLDDRMEILCHDVKNITQIIPSGSVDIVACNPPYYKVGDGAIRLNTSIAMARHEIALTLEELVENVSKILKFGGMFYLIHKAERLAEVIACLVKYNLTPKKLYNILTGDNNLADTFVIVCKLGAKHGMTVEYLKHD